VTSCYLNFQSGAAVAAGVANFFLLDHCAYDNTPGAKVLKTFRFLATGSWFGAAVKRCQCTRKHEPLMLKHVGEDGSVKTDGRQNILKQSGFYPRALGISIVQAWQQKGAWHRMIHGVINLLALAMGSRFACCDRAEVSVVFGVPDDGVKQDPWHTEKQDKRDRPSTWKLQCK